MAKLYYLPDRISKLYTKNSTLYLLHSTPITVIYFAHVYILKSLLGDSVHYADIVNDLGKYFETLNRTFLEEKEFSDKFKLARNLFKQEMAN